MKKIILLIGIVLWSCDSMEKISAKDALLFLNDDKYFFLDVRTYPEHNTKSIPNTKCIPLNEVKQRLEELHQYQNKKLIVYCRSGNRSKIATEILKKNDFDAMNLEGGINAWKGEVVYGK